MALWDIFSGMVSGGTAGAMMGGPWGAGIGAALGGVSGLFTPRVPSYEDLYSQALKMYEQKYPRLGEKYWKQQEQRLRKALGSEFRAQERALGSRLAMRGWGVYGTGAPIEETFRRLHARQAEQMETGLSELERQRLAYEEARGREIARIAEALAQRKQLEAAAARKRFYDVLGAIPQLAFRFKSLPFFSTSFNPWVEGYPTTGWFERA